MKSIVRSSSPSPPTPLNVAVVQLCCGEDVAANVASAVGLIRDAAAAGATVIALPEDASYLKFTSGAIVPMEPLDGPTITGFRALAGELGVWLLIGSYPETGPGDGRYYNTSVVIDGGSEGAPIVGTYRKMHMFDVEIEGGETHKESASIAPGDAAVCVDVAGVKTGLSICYDLRFPMLYQWLVGAGARMLTVPAAFTEYTGKDHWLPLLRARAIETQTFVVAANQFGYHGGQRRSYGKSVIIDPWGVVLCTAADGVGWAMARLDFAAQDRVRTSLPCLRHRRDISGNC